MQKLLLSLFLVLYFTTAGWPATWYVRPSGGSYGAEDGTSYVDAWDGFTNITWGVGGVIAGDSLYVCGTHSEYLAIGASGSSGNPIIIRGDYSGDAGIINVAGAISVCLSINSYSYITVDGLDLRNATTRMLFVRSQTTSINNFVIQNCSFTGNSGGIGLQLYCESTYNLSDVTISNCTFDTLDDDGIRFYFGTADGTGLIYTITIEDCTFASIANAGAACRGIFIEFSNIANALTANRLPYGLTIRNNTFNQINKSAIELSCKDTASNLITNNTITDAGYGNNYKTNAVQLLGCKDITVEYNEISNTGTTAEAGDGNAIIFDYANSDVNYLTEDSIARYNYCHDNDVADPTCGAGVSFFRAKNCQAYYNLCVNNTRGMRVDSDAGGGCTGNVIYNNTLVGNDDDGLEFMTNAQTTTVTNNIIADNGGEGADDNSANDPTFTYNCLYNNTGGNYSGFTLGTGCIETDPQILSVARNNFRIGPASSCRNAGTDVSLTRDFEGKHVPFSTAQDIGAFERHPPTIGKIGTQVLGRPYRASDRSEIFGH
jgi:hypothetical protein